MTLRLWKGKAFVQKDFVAAESNKGIFSGVLLKENIYYKDEFELDLYDFYSLTLLHALNFLYDSENMVVHDESELLDILGVNEKRERLLFKLHLDLKRLGWNTRRGQNYGADFLLYDSDPNQVHSKHAVYLFDQNVPNQWNTILAMNRVCGNAKKIMLVAIPSIENSFLYLQLNRWVPEANRE